MDVLDHWQDDPEEVLLDLGFGVDEPDISIKIPSRFINCPSSAEGINIRVFLEAQKMRMDTENPDYCNRFRQLEVLHQVTSVFSNLFNNVSINTSGVTERPVTIPEEKKSSELKEKRKKLAMLLRRASKQTISMAQSKQEPQKLTQTSEKDNGSPNAARTDVKIAFRQPRQCLLENGCLSPLEEEQSPAAETPPDLHLEKVAQKENPQTAPLSGVTGGEHSPALECLPRVRTSLESHHNAASSLKRKPGDRQAPDSFEMEEVSIIIVLTDSKLSEKLIEDCKMDAEQKQDKGPPETQGPEQEQKKPRRKDTPVLYNHPVIPGVKLMKEENRAIFMEDEEKEWKN
ncbi:UNVERIFIED_CONTAM: hypothetical protein FKN15_038263 [Acipenser sinensis]